MITKVWYSLYILYNYFRFCIFFFHNVLYFYQTLTLKVKINILLKNNFIYNN